MIKSTSLTVAAATLAMCMAGNALAQDRRFDGDRDHRGPARYEQRDERRAMPDVRRADHGPQGARFDGRRDARFDHRGPPRHAEWRRGGYVPREYRAPQYVVSDWRARQLQAPPRGYQWVGTGGEFALAAIATGLIAQIVLNN